MIDPIKQLPMRTDAQVNEKAKIVQQAASGYLINRGIQGEVLRQQEQGQQRGKGVRGIRGTGSDVVHETSKRNEGRGDMREAAKRPLRELKDVVRRVMVLVRGGKQKGNRRTRYVPWSLPEGGKVDNDSDDDSI